MKTLVFIWTNFSQTNRKYIEWRKDISVEETQTKQ